jgi:hypothetical protein
MIANLAPYGVIVKTPVMQWGDIEIGKTEIVIHYRTRYWMR